MVFPHSPSCRPLNLAMAQRKKESPMEKVLPLRTAPSQMIASQSPGRHHQVSTLRCFWENRMISAVVPPSFLPGSFRQHPVQLSGPLRLFLAQEPVPVSYTHLTLPTN